MFGNNSAQVLSLRSKRERTNAKPLDPKNGHEAILRVLIKKRQLVLLKLMDGSEIRGHISQFDNYTITVYPEGGNGPTTIFKHSLSSFTGVDAGE